MRLIGIDCSTNPRNIGIALAEFDGAIGVRQLEAGIKQPWRTVAEWLRDSDTRDVLIAIDAPLVVEHTL